ncbi:MAG: DnaD domain protein, partial [Lachnospirales bacterium]
MNDISFRISGGFTFIHNWFIDSFMSENPMYSMVYIYAVRLVSEGRECSNKIIADKLDIFESDVVKAWKYWHKKGVITIKDNEIIFKDSLKEEKEAILEQKPVKDKYYNPSDIEKISEGDKNFDELIETIEKLVGRTLSHNNINIVANMYDKMGLPFEVIVLLVQYYGGKSLSYIEKVAISWCEKGINTMELAEKEINSYNVY